MNYDEIDPGVRRLVQLLNDYEVETTDSGDGVSKPEDERFMDFPHVICRVGEDETIAEAVDFVTHLLKEYGVELDNDKVDVEGHYSGATHVSTLLVRGVKDSMLTFNERREAYIQGYLKAILDVNSGLENPRRHAAMRWESHLAREARALIVSKGVSNDNK